MTTPEPTLPSRFRRARVAIALTCFAALAAAWPALVGAVTTRPGATQVRAVDTVVAVAVGLLATALVLRAALRSAGRARLAWLLLCVGIVTWLAASSVELVLGNSGPILVATLAADLCLLAAVALQPSSPRRRSPTRRIDLAIMAAAAICLLWALGVDRLLADMLRRAGEPGMSGPWLAVTYTALSVVAIVVATVALVRCRPDRHDEIVPLCTGVVMAALADVAVHADPTMSGAALSFVSASYLVGLALLVVAGLRLGRPPLQRPPRARRHALGLVEASTLVALAGLAIRYRVDPSGIAITVALGTVLVLLSISRMGELDREQRALTTSLQASARRLRSEARTDRLTGLGNRLALEERLDLTVEQLGSRPHGSCAWLYYVDLDHFKRINDGLGHQVGDELLVETARRLRAVLGEHVHRVGGDEFVAVRFGSRSDRIEAIAAAVLAAFDQPILADGHELNVQVSVGVAPLAAGEEAAMALQHADLALYRAKRLGRARWAGYSPELQQQADRSLALQQGLHRALAADQLEVHYRPVMDLVDQRIVGAQAHLRWRSPEHGLLSRRSFFDVAIDGALVPQLDAAIFDDVMHTLRRSTTAPRPGDGRPELHWVSIRLSREELTHPATTELVERLVHGVEGDAERLRIEIGEDVVVDPTATEAVSRLHELGVGLTVAGFGTGPSSLIRLDRYPASTIKLDRSFVEGLGRRREDTLVVGTVAQLALDLGLELAADGIEEDLHVRMLRDLGCRLGQGRHVGDPVVRAELFGLVSERAGASR